MTFLSKCLVIVILTCSTNMCQGLDNKLEGTEYENYVKESKEKIKKEADKVNREMLENSSSFEKHSGSRQIKGFELEFFGSQDEFEHYESWQKETNVPAIQLKVLCTMNTTPLFGLDPSGCYNWVPVTTTATQTSSQNQNSVKENERERSRTLSNFIYIGIAALGCICICLLIKGMNKCVDNTENIRNNQSGGRLIRQNRTVVQIDDPFGAASAPSGTQITNPSIDPSRISTRDMDQIPSYDEVVKSEQAKVHYVDEQKERPPSYQEAIEKKSVT